MLHASALFFEGREESAKKRLQKLKAAGYVAERPRRPFEPAVLHLTKKGLLLLSEHGVLAEYPAFSLPALEKRAKVSAITMPHELAVMDVKAAVCSAVTRSGRMNIAEFTTWPILNQFQALGAAQKPDGFLRVRESGAGGDLFEHCFFLEVDRSTETQEALAGKAARYREHYHSGGFAERMGGRREQAERYPFRVLFVLATEERRNNAAETLLRLSPPVLTQVWLTTLADVVADPLGSVWVTPADYREATEGSAFSPDGRTGLAPYVRSSARQEFVSAKVGKRALIEG